MLKFHIKCDTIVFPVIKLPNAAKYIVESPVVLRQDYIGITSNVINVGGIHASVLVKQIAKFMLVGNDKFDLILFPKIIHGYSGFVTLSTNVTS